MRLPAAEDYYEDRTVAHCQFGDIHDDVPFWSATVEAGPAVSRGRRKRPDVRTRALVGAVRNSPGVVCHYTCGFLAQPPGTGGYSHGYRLVAPVIHMRELLKSFGWEGTLLRGIREQGREHGVLYLPWPKEDSEADEWSGDAAVLLFRPALVTQEVLDSGACPRVKRLSEAAQQLLAVGLIQVVSPNTLDPNDDQLLRPDLTDSWAALAGHSAG
jgi:hypothetical protein